MTDPTQTEPAPETKPAQKPNRRWLWLTLKWLISIVLVAAIVRRIRQEPGAEGIGDVLAAMRWEWLAAALGIHLIGVGFNVVRYRLLLRGQGIHPSWRFLVSSLLIARFIGAMSPGGFTGFGGWRIYDVGERTGKYARATAAIAVETVLGQLAFGSMVMLGSVAGARIIGSEGVLLINAAFGGLMIGGLTFLARPQLFTGLLRFLPAGVRMRVQTLIDALLQYRGRSGLLAAALGCAVVVHATHFLIYVCTAQAVGASQIGPTEVFFGSALQILATMLPTSINGIGLRETTAVALYTSAAIGVPLAVAVLIPALGFAVEMSVSMVGVVFFLARRAGYAPDIRVDDADREQAVQAAIPEVEEARWPKVGRGATIGLGAGLLAGLLVGVTEGVVVVAGADGRAGTFVIAYGAIAYGLFCAFGGAAMGAALAFSGRLMKREAVPEEAAYARITAFLCAVIGFGLTAFRVRRDVFDEDLRWASLQGLGVALGCALAATLLYLAIALALRFVVSRKPGAVMLRAWGSPAIVGGIVLVLVPAAILAGQPAEAASARTRPPAREGAGNVLVIVVDTLRADHLPSYGYESGRTPNLDAFAEDSIRFDQAFANASWTRPSFASIMTGRYASSHGVMGKSAALPDEVTTIAEAFGGAGYYTAGLVTNFNVGPYFNFQQGFDEYRFLEPDYVLGADDTAAKLLLVQFARQQIEGLRDRAYGTPRGAGYRDAEVVNTELFRWLDRAPTEPWMLFVGYMDPHDPYYDHENGGGGYARAAHQTPRPEEAPELMRLYDGEITYWDQHFGRLIAELRERGLYDSTTIVVTADHGEEFHEHGGFWHGTTLYDEQVRVPLFVHLPEGRRAGTVVRHWVQSVDILPTLLREQHIAMPDGIQGGDLFVGTDRVFAEESHEMNVLTSVRERRGGEELKLITANAGNPRGLPVQELFRVDVDPGETHDVAGEDAEDLARAEAALQEARVHAAEGAAQAIEVELDPLTRSQMERIGYGD